MVWDKRNGQIGKPLFSDSGWFVAYPSVTSDEPQEWQNFIAVRRRITMQQNARLVAA
jgi:hypothetical protein